MSGPISLRLLPAPSLRLDAVEIGPEASPVTARKLAMEFGLSGLMRGEFRANEVTVDGLEATLQLDRAGRIAAPVAGLGFDPDRIGIDRLAVSNSRIVLADAASGGRVALDNFNFSGEVRSLLGPFKGEGSFTSATGPTTFRVGGGRRGDDGGVKLRLFVDASASAVSFDIEGTLWVEATAPRFEGAMTVTRVAGAALPDGATAIHEPLKATAKLKATAAGATFDDLEFQYGPDTRPARLNGTANVSFGAARGLAATLAARQIDLDRTFTGADRRLPFDVVKAMAESLAAGPTLPLPVRVSLRRRQSHHGGRLDQRPARRGREPRRRLGDRLFRVAGARRDPDADRRPARPSAGRQVAFYRAGADRFRRSGRALCLDRRPSARAGPRSDRCAAAASSLSAASASR